ncbi:MAG: hypothetical protein KKC68_06380 [Candidatus Thermoplasmatota archaeon]|nr:hypothetical protein [Candidatus Thermoplasmatota archaeon]MBU1941385.1 hypothetical protein [Candidatus Thermoplasmatota archaeon]
MTPHLATYTLHHSPATLQKSQHAWAPELVVLSGIVELDRLLGGFKAGELTMVDGNSSLINQLPYRLCVTTYRTFHSDTIYIDGGMAANPYHIARYARQLELDQHQVLSHVRISRAFTLHQLTTLIQEQLEPLIDRYQPRTLLIGMFPVLYLDPDIASHEAQRLLKHNLHRLSRLATYHQLITILTNRDHTLVPTQRNLRRTIYTTAHEVVRFRHIEQGVYIDLVKQHRATTLRNIPLKQRCLDDFMLPH